LLNSQGPLADENPFRFSSEYFDDESGLVYYNFRYYSPELGRWLSRDPIEEQGGLNLYAMVRNDAINTFDVLGLLSPEECCRLRSEIIRKTNRVLSMIMRYDPVSDAKGGHPIAPWKGGGTTNPGTHYLNIKNDLKGLAKDVILYVNECVNGPPRCPPLPSKETLRKTIPKPFLSVDLPWWARGGKTVDTALKVGTGVAVTTAVVSVTTIAVITTSGIGGASAAETTLLRLAPAL
jgi:RHS repeat-associated protein